MKKIELTKERWIMVIAAAIVFIALGAYFIFYAPLMNRLKTKYIECKSAENEVLERRNIIESAGKGERFLIPEEDVSHAIDELTKHGNLNRINFISMSPKKIEKEKRSQYKILPIEMGIESTYERLGIFLGSLDRLEKGLVKVKSFNIVPDEEDPSKLITDLIAAMYLSGRKNGETTTLSGRTISAKRVAKKTDFVSWKRSPFIPKEALGPKSSKLVLNGVIWDEKRPAAIINDDIVSIGAKVEGNEVIDIQPHKVILNDGINNFELRLGQD